MFALPALFALFNNKSSRKTWWAVGVAFSLLIGFRYEIGEDWSTYVDNYSNISNLQLIDAIAQNDPGFALLNWVSALVGGEIYLVNLVCGAIIMIGIITFSRRQLQPWLALVVSVPYLIIVVSMGYTRQGAAIGFELLAIVAIIDGNIIRYFLFIVLAALFHKTAVVLLPLGLITIESRNRVWQRLLLAGIAMWVALILAFEHYEGMMDKYVNLKMQSDGSKIRVLMNAIPGVLLLLFRKKILPDDKTEEKFWILIAVISLFCVPLEVFASTAVDRMALYFIPLQMYMFSRLNLLVADMLINVISVLILYGFILWVWLTYGNYAYAWVPYKSLLFYE